MLDSIEKGREGLNHKSFESFIKADRGTALQFAQWVRSL